MSLLEKYNEIQNINPKGELEDLIEKIYIRCNNLVVCGDKLSYLIRDIEFPQTVNKSLLCFMIGYNYGINLTFEGNTITVKSFSKPFETGDNNSCKTVEKLRWF